MKETLELIDYYCYSYGEPIPVTDEERLKIMIRLNKVGYITAEELQTFISSSARQKLPLGRRVSA